MEIKNSTVSEHIGTDPRIVILLSTYCPNLIDTTGCESYCSAVRTIILIKKFKLQYLSHQFVNLGIRAQPRNRNPSKLSPLDSFSWYLLQDMEAS